MARTQQPETKWEQRWHDNTIDAIDGMLRCFRGELSVEVNKGHTHGSDIIISTSSSPGMRIHVEVQMHPSGKDFKGTMDRWAQRHTGAMATFVVCPTALMSTMVKRIESHQSLGAAARVFVFGDNTAYLTLLCSSIFSLLTQGNSSIE
jgi:hypothetical protein